ncbi:calcium-binding protein, partial [Roseovarius sp. SYSU LYC5161]|uniref:calcium-binding protein n=1 Tax=Roseovarius halophilus (ex Wu et al. 2025) TaxID=3376060 RepID=UPI00399AA457
MTIFSIDGFSVTTDDTPDDNVIAVDQTNLIISIEGDNFNYRIETPPTTDEPIPFIDLNDPDDLVHFLINEAPAPENANVNLGTITTPQGTHVVLIIADGAGTDHIFAIGGDPIAEPTTPTEFEALDESITAADQASGAFGPNTDIPISSFSNTSVVEGELIEGTDGPDALAGGLADDTINGLDGNDNLNGLQGDDQIDGGGGDDVLAGADGNDTLLGGTGNDQLTGGAGDDLVNPGDNDPFFGDFIAGGTGNDTIDFGDIVEGWAPIDYGMLAGPITVNVDGSANTASVDKGADGTDTILDIDNVLDAGTRAGGTRLGGTASDDVFNILVEADQWISARGNGGEDTFNLSGDGPVQLDFRLGVAVTADLVAGTIDAGGDGSTVTGPVWELRSDVRDDLVTGTNRDESFRPIAGNDTIDGGGGFDRLRYDDLFSVDGVAVDLSAGTVTGTYENQTFTDTITNIEWVRGTDNGDTLTGDAADNRLQGENGDDMLDGGAGADTVEGGDGTDTAVLGVARADAQIVSSNASGITITSADGTDLFLEIERFAFTDGTVSVSDLLADLDTGGETVLGTEEDDQLDGTLGDDAISGGDGNDTIDGGDGNDNIAASDGDDSVDGGSGDDSIGGGLGNDSIDGGDGDDVLGSGQGDDNATGNTGNDIVNGGAGNDFLLGGEGNDTMGASFGADTVLGEEGDDSLGGGTGQDTVDGGAGDDAIGAGEGNDTV